MKKYYWLYAGTCVVVVTCGGSIYLYVRRKRRHTNNTPGPQHDGVLALMKEGKHEETKPKKSHPAINRQFFRTLFKLLGLSIPGIFSRASGIFMLYTITLLCRSLLSIKIAELDGYMVASVVQKKPKLFLWNILQWLLMALPATFVNSLIRFLESHLALSLRNELVRHLYKKYFSNQVYYKVSNLDSRLLNPDQRLTEDVKNFCDAVAHIYSHISKPIFDLTILYRAQVQMDLARGEATSLPFWVGFGTILVSAFLLRVLAPPFGRLVAEEAKRHGFLRFVHSRIITNSEEIAFYEGSQIELNLLQQTYFALVRQLYRIYLSKLWFVMVEQFLMKYIWSISGMSMVAIPLLLGKSGTPTNSDDVISRAQTLTTKKHLLMSSADAWERIFSSYKEMVELAGYTHRLWEMLEVFDDMDREKYLTASEGRMQSIDSSLPKQDLREIPPLAVLVETEDYIQLENISIITPNSDFIVSDLSFKVEKGMHLLITGPNGCGKSSLFRILSNLWPCYGERVLKPPPEKLFYIPQRPYMSLGSLKNQVTYPDTLEEIQKKGVTIAQLDEIMRIVHLNYLVEREGGWDAINDWKDVLSGGEKQRIGMARIFYHMPRFALLDECSSAVSLDAEASIYQTALDLGISLLTISHRPSLWKFHTHLLQFDGTGNWHVEDLNSSARLSLKEEKEMLEIQLAGIPEKQQRLGELCQVLGESSVVISRKVW